MLKVDESTVVTGSSDGLLRVVSLQPNKVLGVIGDHEEFPVEGMCASRDGRVLASFAHDEIVRFWDLSAALSGPDGFVSEEPHFAVGLI
jgi:WD40 repeat protein